MVGESDTSGVGVAEIGAVVDAGDSVGADVGVGVEEAGGVWVGVGDGVGVGVCISANDAVIV